jgi:hypothetical protein
MRVTLLARLKKLNACFAPNQPPPAFRYGWLTTLPDDYSGERHIAVVTKPPADSEEPWEFEERLGRGPDEDGNNTFTVFLTR